MKVRVHPADDHGVGYYRMTWPAMACALQGADIEFSPIILADFIEEKDGTRRFVKAETDCDVAVFQVPTSPVNLVVQRSLQAQGVAVVVDVDDDYHAIPRNNPAWRALHPNFSRDGSSWEILRQCCSEADVVTVTTEPLAQRYASHGRVRVLPNGVPRQYLRLADEPRERRVPPVVGWSGIPQLHNRDLYVVKAAVAGAVQQHGAAFLAIGSKDTLGILGVEGTWADWVTLGDGTYARTVATLDVGIAPLQDTSFTRAKSWLKPLEYAALGVPFVATDLPEYRSLHALGAGLLARTPREWRRALDRLLGAGDTWAEVREAGIAAARPLAYEARTHEWVEAWEAAQRRRAARSPREITA